MDFYFFKIFKLFELMKFIFSTLILFFFFHVLQSPGKKNLFELVENTGIDFNNKVIDGKLKTVFISVIIIMAAA